MQEKKPKLKFFSLLDLWVGSLWLGYALLIALTQGKDSSLLQAAMVATNYYFSTTLLLMIVLRRRSPRVIFTTIVVAGGWSIFAYFFSPFLETPMAIPLYATTTATAIVLINFLGTYLSAQGE